MSKTTISDIGIYLKGKLSEAHGRALEVSDKEVVNIMAPVGDCLIDYYMSALDPELINGLDDVAMDGVKSHLYGKILAVFKFITTE